MSISDFIVGDGSQHQATEFDSDSSSCTPTFHLAYAPTIADSDTECEATEIDSDSPHGSDVELVPVLPAVPADYGNLRFWRGLTNMEQHMASVSLNHAISWQLPEPEAAEDIFHGHHIIKDMLNNGASKIKIGITYQPVIRWSNPRYGYQHLAYTGMKLIYVFESSDKVAAMEKALIGIYRWKDRDGKIVGKPGDRRCANRAPGGESAHVGYSPFFVYIEFRFPRRALF